MVQTNRRLAAFCTLLFLALGLGRIPLVHAETYVCKQKDGSEVMTNAPTGGDCKLYIPEGTAPMNEVPDREKLRLQMLKQYREQQMMKQNRMQETTESKPPTSGTGFVVSRQGHVLTANHVIDGCRGIRTTDEGRTKQLTLVGTDEGNDLALLKLPAPAPSIARFREGHNIRPGDGVVVVGFPLHGLLATEANVTTGTVSALAGIGNNTRFLQITAPVQPGNSGGPLLDQGGNIVGIVVSKLNAIKIASATGDIPQNINFAINVALAKSFLDSLSVKYELASSGNKLESADVGEQAKKFTLLLECLK